MACWISKRITVERLAVGACWASHWWWCGGMRMVRDCTRGGGECAAGLGHTTSECKRNECAAFLPIRKEGALGALFLYRFVGEGLG